jgi:hypothetical protein
MLTGFGTSTQSTYDIRTVAPHLFHYVDLTTKLVRVDRRLIGGSLHIQPKTELKHFRQLFNSLYIKKLNVRTLHGPR